MVIKGPGGDGPDGERGPRPERDTESIPRIPAFEDDDELAGLTDEPASIDYDLGQVKMLGPEKATPYVDRYILPTEKFRAESRRHWIHLAPTLSMGILGTFILGYVAGFFMKQRMPDALTVLLLIWVAVLGWVTWEVVEWFYDRFVLTNKRIMLVEGILSRRVAMMPLARVTDMKYTQTPLGRLLGYGTFEIESAGQDQALRTVKNLPNPTDLYLEVVEEMYEPDASEARRSGTRPGEDGI